MASLRDRGDKVRIIDNEDNELFSVDDEGDVVVTGTLTVDGASTLTGAQTFTGAATFSGNVTVADTKNIVLATSTGTKIGTATSQKLAFFNSTPVSQRGAYTQTYATADKTHANLVSAALATTGAATGATKYGFTTATQANAIATQVNNIRTDLTDVKQLVNSVIDDLQALGLVA